MRLWEGGGLLKGSCLGMHQPESSGCRAEAGCLDYVLVLELAWGQASDLTGIWGPAGTLRGEVKGLVATVLALCPPPLDPGIPPVELL